MKIYGNTDVNNVKAFIVLHRKPSEIIDTDIAFQSISMFACDEINGTNNGTEVLCPYETTPIMKYCSTTFSNKFDLAIHTVSTLINMNQNTEKTLLQMFNQRIHEWFNRNPISQAIPETEKRTMFEEIACDFIKQNQSFYHHYIDDVRRKNPTHEILLGTFYPNQEENEKEHYGNCVFFIPSVNKYFIFNIIHIH